MPHDSYPFNTYTGLLTPEHYKNIGNAIWLFLWCISSTTDEKERDGVVWGIVLGNKPHKLSDLSKIFGVNEKTVRRWLDVLEQHEYIRITRAPYGLILTVKNSKRGFIERVDKNVQSENRDRTKMSNQLERVDKNVHSRSDKSVHSNKDIISTTITTTNKEMDPVDVIAEKFIDLRTMQEGRVIHPNVKDYDAIARIVARGMPLPQTIKLLEQCFHEYAEREPNGAIKAFSYCEKYITDHYEKLKAAEKARQLAKRRIPDNGKPEHKRGAGKTTPEDSITGGQVGRIRRRKTV
ncbi:hypothetical protein [Siminovitchia sp. FSL W7-1587]|uniref:hypothetical protein n=1 Tax=Siminovitchia sp. FSL W7-1587 TaxID=2954699 RepID=UPI0030D38E85